MNLRMLPCSLLLLAIACSVPQSPAKLAPKETVVSNSPELTTALDGRELTITHMVSSGGFSFELVSAKQDGGATVVDLCLTRPAAGSVTTSAFETHKVDVKLPSDVGPIRIRVQQLERDALYEVMPEFDLAMTIER
jgi:hypothetical protein